MNMLDCEARKALVLAQVNAQYDVVAGLEHTLSVDRRLETEKLLSAAKTKLHQLVMGYELAYEG